jgi:hypothetical protein
MGYSRVSNFLLTSNKKFLLLGNAYGDATLKVFVLLMHFLTFN